MTASSTGGWQNWQTVDAGTFQFNPGTYHSVQLHYLSGGMNVNWWQTQKDDFSQNTRWLIRPGHTAPTTSRQRCCLCNKEVSEVECP